MNNFAPVVVNDRCPSALLPTRWPLPRELQGTGQVNWGPASEVPSSAVVCFTAVPSEISRVRPPDANQEFSAGSHPGVQRRRVALFGCC
ncbi:protein of unknown function [Pseudomonas sp. JV241A]|nr:protein of unknown function [Pseudomonas sp. JV241A]